VRRHLAQIIILRTDVMLQYMHKAGITTIKEMTIVDEAVRIGASIDRSVIEVFLSRLMQE
jgi:hypothetical protein